MKAPIVKRLGITVFMVGLLSLTGYFVMKNFRDNLVFFFSPTEILESPQKANKRARLGGMIKKGSVTVISQKDHKLRFTVTDFNQEVAIEYQGFLPDLFREGQGLVAEGYYDQGRQVFMARTVLAKHDENYMPPQVQGAIDKHHGKESLQSPSQQGSPQQ